jgi:ParB-like chromosome segregation protein Spo0J
MPTDPVVSRLPVTTDALNGILRVELWAITRVIPYARNARKIPPAAVAKVAASLREFGWRQPIVVDADGVIVCGHARLLAAQQLGMTEVPVHVAHDLSPAQIKAYRLMDNRSHLEAEWDDALLAVEVGELKGIVDLSLTGFDVAEIDRLMRSDPLAAPGDAPIEEARIAFGVIIECADETEQIGLLKEFATRGLQCRALM